MSAACSWDVAHQVLKILEVCSDDVFLILLCFVVVLFDCLFHCCSPSAQDSKYFHVNVSRQELPKDFGILCDFDREDFETFQVLFNYQMNSKYNKSSNYLTKIGFILGKD